MVKNLEVRLLLIEPSPSSTLYTRGKERGQANGFAKYVIPFIKSREWGIKNLNIIKIALPYKVNQFALAGIYRDTLKQKGKEWRLKKA